MKSVKKTWKFSFKSGALDWIKQLPCTETVGGEEYTFIPARNDRAEARVVRKAIRAAMKERLARDSEILGSNTGTYEEEITIKFDPPGTKSS